MVCFGSLVTELSKVFWILCHKGSYKVELLFVNLSFHVDLLRLVLTRQQYKQIGVGIHGGTELQSIQSFGKSTIECLTKVFSPVHVKMVPVKNQLAGTID